MKWRAEEKILMMYLPPVREFKITLFSADGSCLSTHIDNAHKVKEYADGTLLQPVLLRAKFQMYERIFVEATISLCQSGLTREKPFVGFLLQVLWKTIHHTKYRKKNNISPSTAKENFGNGVQVMVSCPTL